MILSVSRRTDIPRFYGEWFINRIRAGYTLVRNPMNHAQVSRIRISPDVVDCIVFWTKDPAPFLPYLDELDTLGYRYYFQFTLTPYGTNIERNMRPKSELEDTFISLSHRLGRNRVVWRYDPIILNSNIDIAYHKRQFERMCSILSEHTDTVTTSFVDMYRKNRSDLLRPITQAEQEELARFISTTARRYGIRAVACCESGDMSAYGIERAACIDKARIERIAGVTLSLSTDKNQRTGCGCFESIDIGTYNTCPGGCIYCYAAGGAPRQTCDPESELLCSKLTGTERITDRAVRSNISAQTTLF